MPTHTPTNDSSGEAETATPTTVDASVTAVEATSSGEEEVVAEVASHPLPDMFGAQVCETPTQEANCLAVVFHPTRC